MIFVDLTRWLRNLPIAKKVLASLIMFFAVYCITFMFLLMLCGGELPRTWLGEKAAALLIMAVAYLTTTRAIWKFPRI